MAQGSVTKKIKEAQQLLDKITESQEVSDNGRSRLTLSGGAGGGGGGSDDQTHSCQSETSYSMMPKLCDF